MSATGETTDLVKEGVIDPAKVTRSTVQKCNFNRFIGINY